jgi:hypothetical protein
LQARYRLKGQGNRVQTVSGNSTGVIGRRINELAGGIHGDTARVVGCDLWRSRQDEAPVALDCQRSRGALHLIVDDDRGSVGRSSNGVGSLPSSRVRRAGQSGEGALTGSNAKSRYSYAVIIHDVHKAAARLCDYIERAVIVRVRRGCQREQSAVFLN